jgi:hypothetical protein
MLGYTFSTGISMPSAFLNQYPLLPFRVYILLSNISLTKASTTFPTGYATFSGFATLFPVAPIISPSNCISLPKVVTGTEGYPSPVLLLATIL